MNHTGLPAKNHVNSRSVRPVRMNAQIPTPASNMSRKLEVAEDTNEKIQPKYNVKKT
jgi:hypothetical protein